MRFIYKKKDTKRYIIYEQKNIINNIMLIYTTYGNTDVTIDQLFIQTRHGLTLIIQRTTFELMVMESVVGKYHLVGRDRS